MYRMAHIGVVVKDIEKSQDFYQKVLKCEFLRSDKNERLKFVYLKSGNQTIELLQYLDQEKEQRNKGVIDHLAYYVDHLDKEIARLKNLDVELLFETPREVNGKGIMFFKGPDGERIEFMEV